MTGTAGTARVAAPPTDVILRKGRSSLRLRNGLTGSGVLGVVAAAVIAGTTLVTGSGPGAVSPGAATTSARLPQAADAVVTMGSASAKTKVVLYEDYRCPMCKELNTGLGAALQQDVAAGKIQIQYRPTDLIDRNDKVRGKGSVVAGNAVLCAADRGKFDAYRTAVYAYQPVETVDSFKSPAQLIEIARGIPGLDTPAFEKCVNDQPYATAISRNFDTAINTLQCQGMPCVNADGQQWRGPGLQGQKSLGAIVDDWLSQIIASH
jgi:protein-disulfide isomerase